MQRVSITRLLRDKVSHETILVMEALDDSEEIRVSVPWHKAGVLALEAHGLNDRCPLYSLLLACVAKLGGSFGPVVITRQEDAGSEAAISLSHDGETGWVSGEFVELIALALHLQLPIYVSTIVARETEQETANQPGAEIPSVFRETFKQNMLAEGDEDAPSA